MNDFYEKQNEPHMLKLLALGSVRSILMSKLF